MSNINTGVVRLYGKPTKISEDTKLGFSSVQIVPKMTELSSRSEVNLTTTYKSKYSDSVLEGIPIFAANMSTVATPAMANALGKHKIFTCLHKYVEEDDFDNIDKEYSFLTFGMENLEYIKSKIFKYYKNNWTRQKICLDVANGYMWKFIDQINRVREEFPESIIIAGNVCTPEGTEQIIKAGADFVKVGIANGQGCMTKNVTGVGYPQLSMILECVDSAKMNNGYIISDGGCKESGDICKAFAAGADGVMVGGMLSGHRECLSDQQFENMYDNTVYFYGMSSEKALQTYHNGVSSYRASEGRVISVPYKGYVEETVLQILGGLRSACSYTNSKNLSDIADNSTFVKI